MALKTSFLSISKVHTEHIIWNFLIQNKGEKTFHGGSHPIKILSLLASNWLLMFPTVSLINIANLITYGQFEFPQRKSGLRWELEVDEKGSQRKDKFKTTHMWLGWGRFTITSGSSCSGTTKSGFWHAWRRPSGGNVISSDCCCR